MFYFKNGFFLLQILKNWIFLKNKVNDYLD